MHTTICTLQHNMQQPCIGKDKSCGLCCLHCGCCLWEGWWCRREANYCRILAIYKESLSWYCIPPCVIQCVSGTAWSTKPNTPKKLHLMWFWWGGAWRQLRINSLCCETGMCATGSTDRINSLFLFSRLDWQQLLQVFISCHVWGQVLARNNTVAKAAF